MKTVISRKQETNMPSYSAKYGILLLAVVSLLLSNPCAFAQSYLPETHPDYVLARSVYNRVWAAYGRSSVPPELVLRKSSPSARQIAYYQNSARQIRPSVVLDASVVPYFTATFGNDAQTALACILAHELAHHFHGHSKTTHFASKSGNPIQEAQADESGFFYAYLAGYPSFSIAERLFNSLYDQYDLEKKGPAEYPSKKERLASIREKIDEVMILANVYEAGKVLMLTGKLEEAIACLETVDIQRLSAPEVHQNLGILHLLLVLNKGWVSREEMPFILPIEPDMSSRLLVQSRGLPEADRIEKNRLLRIAQKYLEQAYAARPGASSRLNLAVAQLLSGNASSTIGTLSGIEIMSSEAVLVRAIAFLKNGQKEAAKADFLRIEKQPGRLMQMNREIWKEVETKGWKNVTYQPVRTKGNFRVSFREIIPESASLSLMPSVSETPFPITVNRANYGDLFQFLLPARKERGHEEWRIARVVKTGFYNQKHIEIGDDTSRLLDDRAYGQPDNILGTAEGRSYYTYDRANIIFILDDQKVSGWYVYNRLR